MESRLPGGLHEGHHHSHDGRTLCQIFVSVEQQELELKRESCSPSTKLQLCGKVNPALTKVLVVAIGLTIMQAKLPETMWQLSDLEFRG